jgi:hypothetical protein
MCKGFGKLLHVAIMLLGEHNNIIMDNVTLIYLTQSTILRSQYHVNFPSLYQISTLVGIQLLPMVWTSR